jgi:hypothetical protein
VIRISIKEFELMPDDPSERPPQHIANAERELRVREKAYELWEADGSPEGKSDEYWHRARQIIENEAKPGVSRAS